MTAFLPTCRLDILRTTEGTTNAWGDPVDTDTVSASGVPAAVVEDRQTSFLASQQRGGVVEIYTIRLRPRVDVREGDRLRDAAREVIYQVDSVSNPPGVVGQADIRCTARKVAATSTP